MLKESSTDVRSIMAKCAKLSLRLASAMDTGARAIAMVAQVEAALTKRPGGSKSKEYRKGYEAARVRIQKALLVEIKDEEDDEEN